MMITTEEGKAETDMPEGEQVAIALWKSGLLRVGGQAVIDMIEIEVEALIASVA